MTVIANHRETSTSGLARVLRLTPETLFYIVIFVLAVFTRFHNLGDRVMSHDESLHTRFSYNLYSEGDFQHTPLMHGPILFHAAAFSYYLFGDSDFSARIYTSVLGVLMVLSPLLFRRWLGKWGAILATLMLLISPMVLYYNRYIREDTPNLFYTILMMWAILMYLNGPEQQRRREHWLYILAAAMLMSLGSKETAFIYIAIFGIFLALYWFVRLAQYFWNIPGKTVFYTTMMGILAGGVLALGMYIILDIIKFDLFSGPDEINFSGLQVLDQQIYFLWTFLAIVAVIVVIVGTALWAFRDRLRGIKWGEVAYIVGVMFLVCFLFVVVEERSHIEPNSLQPATPNVPGEDEATIRWLPMIATWLLAVGTLAFLYVFRRRPEQPGDEKEKIGHGLWGTLDLFPEFDVMVIIGTLILPWATAAIPWVMGGTATDFSNLSAGIPQPLYALIDNLPNVNGADQVGKIILGFLAWLPLMTISIAIGLSWNWRKWLIAAGIFHAIFAFFFTTVFTNIAGLGTGMIYSLGYWLEQQEVRRGSQPQYYYLLIIMPFYEFLPVIGSVCAMIAGYVCFWRWRRTHDEQEAALAVVQMNLLHPRDGDPVDPNAPDSAPDDTASEAFIAHYQRSRLEEIPFLLFWSWLAVLNLIGYSLAGEKMPWLAIHLTFPMIFLTAWFFGRIFSRIHWPAVRERGWLLLFVLPVLVITLVQVIIPPIIGRGPFQGLSTTQLNQTYSWIMSLAVLGICGTIVLWFLPRSSTRLLRQLAAVVLFSILGVITFRSAWLASFINYDLPTEFIVYAHAAPAIKWVLDDIEELSL
nr:TIGR03663 family protein [Anaerolineae bacterium]